MEEEIPDFISVKRAARIVAPFSYRIDNGREIGFVQILMMLGQHEIRVQADADPPGSAHLSPTKLLSKNWFAEATADRPLSRINADSGHQFVAWTQDFYDWAEASLLVYRGDILDNLVYPFGEGHEPTEVTEAAGKSWSFPQALAWIATKNIQNVAEIQLSRHWEERLAPPSGEELLAPALAVMFQNGDTRRRLIGWLQVITSLQNCQCGAQPTAEKEAWETCQCLGRSYVDLCEHLTGQFHDLPEFIPRYPDAIFDLGWFDGAEKIRLARSEVLRIWPTREQRSRTQNSRAGAQAECERLLKEFFASAPPERTKLEFFEQCQDQIEGLSKKAFDRAWGNTAPDDRRRPGAKRKSTPPN